MAANDLDYQLILKLDNIDKTLASLGQKLSGEGSKIGSQAGKNIASSIDAQAKSLQFGDILKANILSGLALGAFQSAVSGIGSLLSTAFGKSQELTKLGLKYEVLLGSQEAAAQRQQEIIKYAASTPFEVGQITEADTVLQSFGIRSEKLLKNLGNASAVSGKGFSDLSLIIGQISQSKSIGNLNQLYQSGILGKQDLVKAGIKFDLKTGEVESSVDELYTAVNKVIETKFAGGTDKINNTLGGQISTINDNLTQAFDTIFKGSGAEKILLDLAFGLNGAFASIDLKPFASGLKTAFDFIKGLDPSILISGITGIGGAFAVALGSVAIPAITSFIVAAAPFIAIGAGIAGSAYLIQQNWSSVSGVFDIIKSNIQLLSPILDNAKNSVLGFGSQAGKAFDDLKSSFNGETNGGSGINNLLKSLGIDSISSNIITDKILTISGNAKQAFSELSAVSQGQNNGGSGLAKVLGIDTEQGNIITSVLSKIRTDIVNLPGTLSVAFAAVKQFFIDTFNNPLVQAGIGLIVNTFQTQVLPALTNLGTTISTLLLPVLTQLFNFLGIVLPPVLTVIGAILGGLLITVINTIVGGFALFVNTINIVINIVAIFASTFQVVFGTIVSFLSAIFQTIVAIFTGNFGSIKGIWTTFLIDISTLWGDAWTTISTALTNIWLVITTTITNSWNNVVLFFTNTFVFLQGIWNTFWGGIFNKITEIWNNIVTTINTKMTEMSTTINTKIEEVKTFFNGLKESVINTISSIDLVQIGSNIMQGLINGIQNMAGAVASAVANIASSITSRIGGAVSSAGNSIRSISIGNNAAGTMNWRGGLTTVAEQGREFIQLPSGQAFMANALSLLDLPKGSKIWSNPETERLINSNLSANANLQLPNLKTPASSSISNNITNSTDNSQSTTVTNNYTNQNRFAFGNEISILA
jgi:phage-related protein